MTMRKSDFEKSLIKLKKDNSVLHENFTYLREALNHTNKELSLLNKVHEKDNNRRKVIDYEAEIDNLQIYNDGIFKLYSSVCDENLSLYKEIEELKTKLKSLETSVDFEEKEDINKLEQEDINAIKSNGAFSGAFNGKMHIANISDGIHINENLDVSDGSIYCNDSYLGESESYFKSKPVVFSDNEIYRYKIGENTVEWNKNKYKITDVDMDNGRIKFREV